MRIVCLKCQNKAVIHSSSIESDEYKKLYCTCSNPECGHSFAMDLSFSHTISPSALDLPPEIREKLKEYTPYEQKKFFAEIVKDLA